ncbi:hypothetical protein [Paenibacillus flagellatus]|uniref:Uncharacterized protein n=1 Tax=Paenibacillus flagellatus TaxID=2211139 RepID=A0A2V5K2U6_9BACL|nr:hypothetical protein [Paenibacillus flagellatus]PYI53579.1 hypothetical protein DLM86_17625 [Paenibacillus flagellatus]
MRIHWVAGILVGYFNAAWSMVWVASVLWGIVFCAFMLRSYKDRKEQFLSRLQAEGKTKMFGLRPNAAYYVREFVLSAGTAFVVGSAVQAVKSMMAQ